MKKCPFCGADIEESSRFCLYCMQALEEKEQIVLHKKKKPHWFLIIAAIVAIFLIFVLTWFPKQTAQETTPSSDDPQLNSSASSSQTEASTTPPTTEPNHIHNYTIENTSLEYQKQAATCTTLAVYYYSCLCGEKGSETFSHGELGAHIIITDPGRPANCVDTGLTDGAHCSVCNIVLLSPTSIPVISHAYDSDQDNRCNVCNYTRVLNCKHEETVKLPAIAPTCIASGLTEGNTCVYCEEILTAQKALAPLGHTEVIDTAIAASCTTDGKTEGKHCTSCNAVLLPQITIYAKGHTEVIDPAIAPTCTTDGKTEGKHCAVCLAVLVPQQLLSSGHSFSSEDLAAPCSRCGAPSSHIHSYTEENTDEKYLRTAATCTSQPTYYYSCLCGAKSDTFFHSGSAAGHTIVKVSGYAPDCVNPGLSDSRYCSVCKDDFEGTFTLPALGHTFEIGQSNATCVYCGIHKTLTVEAPDFPLVVYNFRTQKSFQIDRVTYAVKEERGSYSIKFIFYGTNISSETAYFDFDVSLHGQPYNKSLSGSATKSLAPNQSGTFQAETTISDLNGTYTLVFY